MIGLGQLFIEQAVTFAWILGRIAGFLVTSPFPGAEVPKTGRITIALSLAWVVSSFASPAVPVAGLELSTLMVVAVELGLGATMGFVLRILLSVADMTGDMMAQAIGLQTGAVLDPDSATPDPTLTKAVSLAGMLLAISLGAHRIALAHVLESFRSLPVGGALTLHAAVPALSTMAGEVLATSVRLALPVIAVCLLTQVGLATIARAAPAMQIFNVGLAITIGAGLMTILATADGLGAGLAQSIGTMPEQFSRVLSPLR